MRAARDPDCPRHVGGETHDAHPVVHARDAQAVALAEHHLEALLLELRIAELGEGRVPRRVDEEPAIGAEFRSDVDYPIDAHDVRRACAEPLAPGPVRPALAVHQLCEVFQLAPSVVFEPELQGGLERLVIACDEGAPTAQANDRSVFDQLAERLLNGAEAIVGPRGERRLIR